MKTLNYFLCIFCLICSAITAIAWVNTAEGAWIELSGYLILSAVIFMLFYTIEEEKEKTSYWRDQYYNTIVSKQRNFFNEVTKKECEIEKIDSVS